MLKFVLIGGIARSGTNLVRRIIGSHSKIAIPPGEFNFFSKYTKGKTVEEILKNPRLNKWNINFSDLRNLDHREVFIQSLQRYADKIGKEIPGEKTPFNEFYYDIFKEWLKNFDLKFIHLVRNPFDVMASYKHFQRVKNKQNYNIRNISRHIINWQRSVSMGLARAYMFPSLYYLLKYEDIAFDPESRTREICSFLGVDFEKERLLNFSDYAGHKDNTSFPENDLEKHRVYNTIRRPESRKHHLDKSEIQQIVTICGELANALGYNDPGFLSFPPEGPNLDITQKLKQYFKTRILSRAN